MSNGSNEGGKLSYSAPALTKGLEVLELLAEADTSLTMKAIADGLGRSKNEIFRMLVALQERGYIERDAETDAFSLTDRLFKLGLHTPSTQDLMTAAMPELSTIALESQQSPHLVVISHGLTVVTAAVPGGEDMSFTLRLGYGRLATDSTSGQVILAFQSPATAKRIIDECQARSAAPIDRKALDKQLTAIRRRGYELHNSRDFVGITDICCPVIDADGNAIASIIIAYINRHTRESRHAATLSVLQAACDRISARLSPRLRSPKEMGAGG
ncbi:MULTISPECIES: IclR family transcriptional regulator [Rhizobium]|uniref:Transcriptional regulator, IclR family n=1 Tax=Rhizobium lusitanum TaxID=293958 RepID=A0A1C3WNN5_9HYPH|nr:IclR family transcriptional regulator [Rhizobium lusitanum]SCB41702.1 transcriptional regulator, IclR family [Rhizobium lusitanum]